MKLIINYDFIEAIRNVNEPLGPMKVVRNKKRLLICLVPYDMTLNLLNQRDLPTSICMTGLLFGSLIASEIVVSNICKVDPYALKSSNHLKRLVPQLNSLNVSTDYDLLLKSELYESKYRICLNEDKLPQLMESKYILVQSYTFSGEIKETSILQEHSVGSKKYVLSIGSPKRQFKLARVNA